MIELISRVDRKYRNLRNREIHCELVDHLELASFFRQKSELDSFLKSMAGDDHYVQAFKARLAYLAFEYANCPLPFNSDFFYRLDRWERLKSAAKRVTLSYPSQATAIEGIMTCLEALRVNNENPLFEKFEQLAITDCALILVNPDYTHPVSDFCEAKQIKIKVTSANALVEGTKHRGVFFGSAKYFPLHTFWAPEYAQCFQLRYGWLADHFKGIPMIEGQVKPVTFPHAIFKGEQPHFSKTEIEIANPVEDFNINTFEQYKQAHLVPTAADAIEAKTVVLTSGKFVFLPAAEGYQHHCLVNLDKEPEAKRIPISQFDQNTAILLRERGSGDYVAEVANKLMGIFRARVYRENQQRWKNGLRAAIEATGVPRLSEALKQKGCNSASPQNLRNWAAVNSIRPESDTDFLALLEYVGLTSEGKSILNQMNFIRSAHIRAGHEVSHQLKDLMLRDREIQSILAEGHKMYHSVNGVDAKLGIYLFKDTLAGTLTIPYGRIGEPNNVEAVYG